MKMKFRGLATLTAAFLSTLAAAHAQAPSADAPGSAASAPARRPIGKLVWDQRPEYPAAARQAHATGITRVELKVSPDGQVLETKLLASSGTTAEHQLLDQTALASMAHCHVEMAPWAAASGQPQLMKVEYVWKLDALPLSLDELRNAAEAGNPEAQVELAMRLSTQLPLSAVNEELATQWYRRAAEKGNTVALMRLAGRARDGVGMPQSFAQSVDYYKRASELGQPEAMYWVADAYAKGRGVDAEPKQALAWHLRAGTAGYAPSLLLAGDSYRDGIGTPADPKRALLLYLMGDRLLREAMARQTGAPAQPVPMQWQRDAAIDRLKDQLGEATSARITATAAAWKRGQSLPS